MKNFAKVAELTQENDHTGAYIAACKIIGGVPAKHIAKKLEAVKVIQDLEGELPSGIYEYRMVLYNQMKTTAGFMLSAEEYDNFYGSL